MTQAKTKTADDDKRAMRMFETGATRDSCDDKPDYEGFLSPRVIEAFGDYMHHHRHQADGHIRDSDNWQKGITKEVYMKSLWRHFVALWKAHRGLGGDIDEALAAIMFNTQGYWHELLKESE